jgi:hypothetical protein
MPKLNAIYRGERRLAEDAADEVYHPVTHLRLNQYITAHWMGIGDN